MAMLVVIGVRPPRPRGPRRGKSYSHATRGGGYKLVQCGCPLSGQPHTRDEHASAELHRDIPHLFPARNQ